MTCYILMEPMSASLSEVWKEIALDEHNPIQVITVVHTNKISKCEVSELENFLGSMTVDVGFWKKISLKSRWNFRWSTRLHFQLNWKCAPVIWIFLWVKHPIFSVLSPKRILIGDDGRVKICASAAIECGGAVPVRYSAVSSFLTISRLGDDQLDQNFLQM